MGVAVEASSATSRIKTGQREKVYHRREQFRVVMIVLHVITVKDVN